MKCYHNVFSFRYTAHPDNEKHSCYVNDSNDTVVTVDTTREINTYAGADLDRVDRVPEACQRFQIYQITGF